jgi:hypothetical protein
VKYHVLLPWKMSVVVQWTHQWSPPRLASAFESYRGGVSVTSSRRLAAPELLICGNDVPGTDLSLLPRTFIKIFYAKCKPRPMEATVRQGEIYAALQSGTMQ